MINGVINADALPVLERMMQFAGARHRVITHNIANLDTPNFRPVDVSIDAFQTELRGAIDERRERHGNAGGSLRTEDTEQVSFERDGMTLNPQPTGENIMFHDRNDRDLERTMQDLVENFTAFRTAAQLMRSRFDLINTAIRERI